MKRSLCTSAAVVRVLGGCRAPVPTSTAPAPAESAPFRRTAAGRWVWHRVHLKEVDGSSINAFVLVWEEPWTNWIGGLPPATEGVP